VWGYSLGRCSTSHEKGPSIIPQNCSFSLLFIIFFLKHRCGRKKEKKRKEKKRKEKKRKSKKERKEKRKEKKKERRKKKEKGSSLNLHRKSKVTLLEQKLLFQKLWSIERAFLNGLGLSRC